MLAFLVGSLAPVAAGAEQPAAPDARSFSEARDAVQALWDCMLDWRETAADEKQREVLLPKDANEEEDPPLDAWQRYMERRRERKEGPEDALARFDRHLAECAARAMIRAARADGIAEGCLAVRGQAATPAPALPDR